MTFAFFRIRLLAPFVLVAGFLVLCGCSRADDGIIGLVDPADAAVLPSLRHHEIFVMTSRAPDRDQTVLFSGRRSPDLGLGRLSVSVPPGHRPGRIELSRSDMPDPQKHFTVTEPTLFATDRAFVAALQAELNRRPPGNRNVLVFVHGYNTSLSEAVLRLGQFVEDSGYKGVPVLFSWASGGHVLDYVYDTNSALQARDHLLHGARLIARTNAKSVDTLSHSLGNLLTVETLRQAKIEGRFGTTGRLRYIILASPDIDMDLFRQQLEVFSASERRFYVLISRDDSALNFSRFLARGVPRVGNEDVEELAGLGVTVIDLSQIKGSGSAHTKFAESPDIVQLIGERLSVDGPLRSASRTRTPLSALLLPITVTTAALRID